MFLRSNLQLGENGLRIGDLEGDEIMTGTSKRFDVRDLQGIFMNHRFSDMHPYGTPVSLLDIKAICIIVECPPRHDAVPRGDEPILVSPCSHIGALPPGMELTAQKLSLSSGIGTGRGESTTGDSVSWFPKSYLLSCT